MSTRGMATMCSSWLGVVEKLPEVHARFQRVQYRPKSELPERWGAKPLEPRKNQHKGNPVVLDGDDEDEEEDDEPEEEDDDEEEAEDACCDCRFSQTSAQDEPCVSCLSEHKYYEPADELVPTGLLTVRQAIQAMRSGKSLRYLGWRPTQWMEHQPDTGFVDEAGIIFDETHLITYYSGHWENQAKYWPTPTTKGFDNGSNSRLAWKKRQSWPTPAARDYKGPSGPDHLVNGTGRKHMDQLQNFAIYCLHPDLTKSNSGKKSSLPTQRLNPRFVEWLMGWPLGFTAIGSESSETEWSLWQSLMASHFSRLLTSLESTSKTERQKMLF